MARGRPSKKGLDWFKKDVNYYEDFKVMDLMNEYGPIGSVIFDCVLCMIYREGYYLEISLDKLSLAVIKTIGSKWLKKKSFVLQVIHYCAEIGLFNQSLLERNVLTSAGIQRRYAEVTSRNKVDKSLYWLIDENGQPLKNIPFSGFSATENRITATENAFSDAESPQEKEKEIRNKNKRESIAAASAAAPSLDEVKAFFKGKNGDPERFLNWYLAQGWKVNGEPIENWHALAANWIKNERPKPLESEPTHKPSYDLDEYEKYDIFSQQESKEKSK